MKCTRCKLINPVNTDICKRCYTPLLNTSNFSNELHGGIYRDNNLLVIELKASLPKRCYKCNSPNIIDNEVQELEYVPYLQKRLKWAVGKVIPASGILPLTPGRKVINLHLSICNKHRSKKPLFFKVGVITIITNVIIFFLSARILTNYSNVSNYITIATAIFFCLGLILLVGLNEHETVEVNNYRDSYFWVKGFGEDYLKSFPSLTDARNK